MRLEDMVLISVDDHVIEPSDLFDGRVAQRHIDGVPTVVRDSRGIDRWAFQGQMLAPVGDNGLMGQPPSRRHHEPATFAEARLAYIDVHERVRDMDANGQWGALCFPTFPRFAGQVFLEAPDKDLSLVCLQAYNDWHLDGWCGSYPDRFIPLGLVPLWDPKLAAAEVRRLAGRGCRAVSFSENPSALSLPSVHTGHWDPFFAACAEEGTVPCIHVGSSSRVPITSRDVPTLVHLVLVQQNSAMAATDWLLSAVFDKFPTLRVTLSEGGIAWIPGLVQHMQHMNDWHGPWLGHRIESETIADRFRRHFGVCFVNDPLGLELRDRIGVEIIMWESDYPHPDSTWPRSPELLWQSLTRCTPNEIDQITHRNACRIYGFDPFSRQPREACTVGARRSKVAARDLEMPLAYSGVDKRTSIFARSVQPDPVGP